MNKKLYIRNIPFTAEEGALEAHFKADGLQVVSVRIPKERETGRSRGFGFIEMATPEDAQKAIQTYNGREFMGRPLTVDEAREQEPRSGGGGGRGFGGGGHGGGGGRGFGGGDRGRGGRGGGGGRDGGRDRDRGSRGGDDW